MFKKIIVSFSGLFALATSLQAQNQPIVKDTLSAKEYLPDITIVGKDTRHDIHQLPEIVGTHIFAGKKNALVVLDHVNGNIVTNNMRQVMAKVPGIHVWESDGSGIQIGVSTRGLSPNRSWDFNVRQNGYDISAEPFGYPEAYYNPPLQAVQRLQIVKGAGSLQFGPQLGGVLNYIIRNGSDINKKFSFETQQTVGSFGMFNSFNAIGGENKKSHYYAFFDHRNADGWRENSEYKTNTGFATYTYRFTDKFKVTAEMLRYSMLSQQPGGLTDSMFKADARQSYRNRNWFNNEWTMGALTFDYSPNANNVFNLKIFGLHGDRNSNGYIQPITVRDTINPATMQYNYRTLEIDKYRNLGAELRYLHHYSIAGLPSTLTASARYFRGHTERLKNGKGDRSTGFNTINVDAVFPQELNFATNNYALALENVFRLTKNLIVIPGARFESVTTNANGRLSFNSNGTENRIDETRGRSFVLLGLAAEYHIGNTEVYTNFTQSYRPMQFADLSVSPTTDVIDPNLKDAKGFNIDLGYRGKLGNYLFFDASVFYLDYDNRIGTITQLKADGSSYNFRTNVGNSRSRGVEALVEINPFRAAKLNTQYGEVSIFASYAYTDAKYQDFKVITKGTGNTLVESTLKGKSVENAPEHILRTGITYMYKGFSLTGQLSYVSDVFADANNTLLPNAAATTGLIPAYTVTDLAASYRYKDYTIKAGINNLGDARYFTRRAGGYPGPGLMPSDARSFYVTIGAKF